MSPILIMLAFLAASPSPAAPDPADRTAPDRPPSTMTSSEIKAHNEGLPMTHPYYVKCRKIEEIGSLVKKLRVCNTNAQWRRIVDKGNQDARDTMETLARGWTNPQEPADQLVTIPRRPQ